MEHINVNTLGKILKAARKFRGLTREKIAESVGISPRYLSSLENENPSYILLFRLIRALGISADMIFYPDMEKRPVKLNNSRGCFLYAISKI